MTTMTNRSPYTYKDFITRNERRTFGEFIGWQRGGPLHVYGAVFRTAKMVIFVPDYCLTKETRERLPAKSKEDVEFQNEVER